MAITITKIHFLKEGLSGSRDDEGNLTQEQTLRVEFSGVVNGVPLALSLIASAGFRSGSLHPVDFMLYLTGDIDAEVLQDDTGKTWDFRLSYTSKGANATQNSNTGDYRPEVKTGKWAYTVVVDRDKETGDPIANTVGDPYDPLPIDTISAPTLSVTVQEFSANMNRLTQLGSINSGAITIVGVDAPKYCCMFDDYQSTAFWDEEGFLTFKNTFTFKYKFFKNKAKEEIGFKLEAVNQGFNKKDATAPNEKAEIKVADPEFPTDRTKDVPVAVPQMLTEAGVVTNEPFYQEWVVHDLLDFTQFALPTAYPVI